MTKAHSENILCVVFLAVVYFVYSKFLNAYINNELLFAKRRNHNCLKIIFILNLKLHSDIPFSRFNDILSLNKK